MLMYDNTIIAISGNIENNNSHLTGIYLHLLPVLEINYDNFKKIKKKKFSRSRPCPTVLPPPSITPASRPPYLI